MTEEEIRKEIRRLATRQIALAFSATHMPADREACGLECRNAEIRRAALEEEAVAIEIAIENLKACLPKDDASDDSCTVEGEG